MYIPVDYSAGGGGDERYEVNTLCTASGEGGEWYEVNTLRNTGCSVGG
jgi:hypothetical protein